MRRARILCVSFSLWGILFVGDKMKDNKQLLTSVLHTVQMGQTGIRSVENSAHLGGLKEEMANQLKEYDAIEKEALSLADQRGWQLTDVHPALRKMSDIMSRVRLTGGDADSKIAGMLIQGNTRGMILGIRNLHDTAEADPQVLQLAQKLLDREQINIQKSQDYL